MRERAVDRKLVDGVKKLGGVAIKLSSLGARGSSGWPDRLVLLPGGVVCFVEVKAPGNEPTELQKRRLAELRRLGFDAWWTDDARQALERIQNRCHCGKQPVLARGLCNRCYHRMRAAKRPERACECGCGELTKGPRFISGHNTRFLSREEQSRRAHFNDGSKQRDCGAGKTYRKVRGRHEHRIVAEQVLGRALLPGEIVHHRNGDKRDNRPENLEVMTQAEHARLHFKEWREARHG